MLTPSFQWELDTFSAVSAEYQRIESFIWTTATSLSTTDTEFGILPAPLGRYYTTFNRPE